MDKLPALTLAKRELESLRSEKTILVVIVVQLLVASFSSVLVVGVVSMYDPGSMGGEKSVKFGLVGEERDVLAGPTDSVSERRVAQYLSVSAAYDAYHAGEIDAILRAERLDSGRLQIKLVVPNEGFKKTAAVGQAQKILQKVQSAERDKLAPQLQTEPLPLPDGGSPAPFTKFTYTVMLPILLFLPAFVSGSLVSDSFTEGVTDGTLELLRVSPLTVTNIFDAKALSMAVLAPVQSIMWIGLMFLNGTPVSNIPALIGVVSGLTLLMVAIGAGTAYWFRERSQTQFGYAILSMTTLSAFYIIPEHPMNAIAKLALNNPTPQTYPVVGAIITLGIISYTIVRQYATNWSR